MNHRKARPHVLGLRILQGGEDLNRQQFVFLTQCVLKTGNDTDTDTHRW